MLVQRKVALYTEKYFNAMSVTTILQYKQWDVRSAILIRDTLQKTSQFTDACYIITQWSAVAVHSTPARSPASADVGAENAWHENDGPNFFRAPAG